MISTSSPASPRVRARRSIDVAATATRRTVLSGAGLTLAAAFAGCAGLPDKPVQPLLYDFGPPAALPAAPVPASVPMRMAWVLGDIETSGALDSTAMHFRLAYADAQALRAYALARWAMPPAQLLRQTVRARLAAQQPVLTPAEAATLPREMALTLVRLELIEFAQVFDAAERSQAVVRMQATVAARSATGPAESLLGQRMFETRAPARSADASGGAAALAAAADAMAIELERWLRSLR